MPVYTTYISGSGTSGSLPNTPIHGRIIGAQITGSLHVKGSSSITGSIDATGGGRFGTGVNITAGGIFSVGSNDWTGNTTAVGNIDASGNIQAKLALSSSGGLITTGTVYHGDPSGAVLLLRRDDVDHITDGELIGAIDFWGQDTNENGAGARIAASASAAWVNNYKRQTDLKFFTQDDGNLFDGMVIPRLIISGGGTRPGCVGIDKGLFVHATASMKSLQVGGDYTTPGLNAGYPLRVSNTSGGDVGIAIDSDNNKVGSINFTNDDPGDGGGTGLYVDWAASTPNRVSIRRSTDLQENGALVIHSNMNSVRVGGGAGAGDTADNVCLLVTSSLYSEPSIIRIRTKHGSRSSDAYPVISWMHEAANSNSTGHWAMGIDPQSVGLSSGETDGEYLRICATGPNSSALTSGVVAMTFREGGTDAGVGIGGDSTRAMIPTGTLHVENQKNANYDLENDLHVAQLILGNNSNTTNKRSAGVYFNVSTDDDPEFHSAHVVAANTSGTAAGYQSQLSFAVNDGSGLKDSVRQRLRIDSQGAVLIVSGTNTGAGGTGFPLNNVTNWEVEHNDIPSGSLTITSLSNAGGTGDNIDPATISLVSWPGNTGKGQVTSGYNMGRIQWWSADSEFTGGEENKTVSGYIQGIAAAAHSEANLSPMAMEFYVRNTGGLKPDLAMKIRQTGIVEFQKSIVTLGASLEAIGVEEGAARVLLQADLSTDAGDDWSISANAAQTLTFGNDIANSGAYVPHLTITPHATVASSEVTAHGKLKVEGGTVTLNGTGRINDAGGDTRFYFTDGGNTIIGGATATTSATFSDTDVTIAGDLFVNDYARIDALRVGTTSTDPGDGNLHVEGEVRTAQIAFTDGDDAIAIADNGYLEFPAGVKKSPAVVVNGSQDSQPLRWIKFATTPVNATSSDTRTATFLVEMAGADINAQLYANQAFLVKVKHTFNTSAPYWFSDPGSTYIRVDTLMNEEMADWDPAADIALELEANGSSNIWIRSRVAYKDLFVTHLGTGYAAYHPDDDVCDASWMILSGESWASSVTTGATSIAGEWTSKKYKGIEIVSGSLSSAGPGVVVKPASDALAVGALHLQHETPVLRLSDTDAGTAQAVVAYVDFYQGISTSRLGFFGFSSTGNEGMVWRNESTNGYCTIMAEDGIYLNTRSVAASDIGTITLKTNDAQACITFELDGGGNQIMSHFGHMYHDMLEAGHTDYWRDELNATRGYISSGGDIKAYDDLIAADDVYVQGVAGTTSYNYARINTSDGKIWYHNSTRKVKKNIEPSSLGLSEILQLRPVTFQMKDPAQSKLTLGMIAEEAADVHPLFAIMGEDWAYDSEGKHITEDAIDDHGGAIKNKTTLSDSMVPNDWDHDAVIVALVNAVKELNQKIEDLS